MRRSSRSSRFRRRRLVLGAVVAAAALGAAAAILGHRTPAPRQPVARPLSTRSRHRPSHGARAGLRLALPRTLPSRRIRVPILMYHRIGTAGASMPRMTRALTVSPAVFAAQMRWLERHGFHGITQEQLFAALEHGARLPSRPVMITFDDGYRDVLWNAAPVLQRLHLPATDYVITGRVSGPDASFLTWPELRMLEARGIEIGSHTVHHLELTLATNAVALHELRASKRSLEAALHHPVQWFAYPAGRENARVLPLVWKAGYVLAVTTLPGEMQAADDPFRLRRYEILDTTGVAGLSALLRRPSRR